MRKLLKWLEEFFHSWNVKLDSQQEKIDYANLILEQADKIISQEYLLDPKDPNLDSKIYQLAKTEAEVVCALDRIHKSYPRYTSQEVLDIYINEEADRIMVLKYNHEPELKKYDREQALIVAKQIVKDRLTKYKQEKYRIIEARRRLRAHERDDALKKTTHRIIEALERYEEGDDDIHLEQLVDEIDQHITAVKDTNRTKIRELQSKLDQHTETIQEIRNRVKDTNYIKLRNIKEMK